jgi:uncharacterized protein
MDDCQGQLPPHVKEGLRLFNQGQYFECHEALELAWRAETGEVRNLYKGILQAAVVYLHMKRGNHRGAVRVYQRAIRLLNSWPDACRGVYIAGLRANLTRAVEAWEELGPDRIHEMDWSLLKPLEWHE